MKCVEALRLDEHGKFVSFFAIHRLDWDKYCLPPKVRHGSMLPITRQCYNGLVAVLGKGRTVRRKHKKYR